MDELLETAVSFGVKIKENKQENQKSGVSFITQIKKKKKTKSSAGTDRVYKSKQFCYYSTYAVSQIKIDQGK